MNKYLYFIFGFVVCLIFAGFGSFADERKYNDNISYLENVISNQKAVIDSLSVPIIKKEDNWNTFIKALIYIESKNNDNAVNEYTDAVGCLQITKIYVDQLQKWGYNYTYDDRYNRQKSIEMFNITNIILNPDKDLHFALVIHNGRASYNYHLAVFNKYNQLMKQNE